MDDASGGVKIGYYFLILRKNVSARFARKRDENNNFYENPLIGTTISENVTNENEFYLISQNARQGTVNPTNYKVIAHSGANSQISEKAFICIREITFKLTHMYYNWPSQIKVPAPCQYANKLATLIGEHMKLENFTVNPELEDKLFYL